MRSGDESASAYERLVKLWISLWTLILEEKRHLETVTALLQRIVFEERGYPKFKNWPEICKLGETDHLLMMAVATVDPGQKDERVQQLIAAFPQCFSSEEVHGPVPLSVIRHDGRENGSRQGDRENGEEYPVSYDAVPGWMPLEGFDKFGNQAAGFKGPRLPNEIDPDAPQGSVVEWEGRKFIVIENNESCEELWIVPAECIHVDVEVAVTKPAPEETPALAKTWESSQSTHRRPWADDDDRDDYCPKCGKSLEWCATRGCERGGNDV